MTSAASVDTVQADALLAELVATPEGRADPYSRYARLREIAPVHRSAFGFCVLTRYDDCVQLLRASGVGKDFSRAASALGLTEAQQAQQAAFRNDRSNMLFADPPDHTRLRRLASRAFTPRSVEALRPRVVELVDGLLDEVGTHEVDVMSVLAFPLPVTVIGEMLGVPAEDRPQFRSLVRAVTAVLELVISPEALNAATEASEVLEGYFAGLVAERRAHPGDDLLSRLILAEDEGERLSEWELISTAILLFAAGFETTTHLIGNGLLALVQTPDQLARLREDRTLLRPAVEELLRYDSPVQITARTTYEDVRIGDALIEADNTVLALIGAANRDPARFTDPDRLDVGRAESPPMSFGSGIHHCLGAALARLEAQVVLDRLLDRFGTIELVGGQPQHRDSLTLRGLVDLRMRFAA
ncbi:MAG TPA: cytochrome P450 [Acidimicrobiales bacterium]|nr:cytochrome P450 [Acidimicrobiales bacterium]